MGNPQIEQLIHKVKRLQNGDVSRTMKRLGLNYGINYGVSIPQLRQIANQTSFTKELAFELLKLDIREAKLLASMLLDVDQLKFNDLCELSLWISNLELVEHFSRSIFSKHNELAEILPLLEQQGYWQQMLAIYSASWHLKMCSIKLNKVIIWSDAFLTKNLASDDLQMINALSFLMPALSSVNEEQHDKMVNLAEKMVQSENSAVQQLAQDFLWLKAL